MTFSISLIAIFLYLGAAGLRVFNLAGHFHLNKLSLLIGGFIAVLLHAELLHHWIDLPTGQNLNNFNLFSMASCLAALLLILAAIRKPIENLCLIIYPIAALSIILILIFPRAYVVDTTAQAGELVHILLAIVTFSILCFAAIQAIGLAIQEYLLRHQAVLRFVTFLPPLQTMESLLFQTISLGFVLLTIVAISSIISFGNIFTADFIGKTSVVFLSWLVFLVLLTGRYALGWRGKMAIRFTLLGVILLAIVYYGTRVLLAN